MSLNCSYTFSMYYEDVLDSLTQCLPKLITLLSSPHAEPATIELFAKLLTNNPSLAQSIFSPIQSNATLLTHLLSPCFPSHVRFYAFVDLVRFTFSQDPSQRSSASFYFNSRSPITVLSLFEECFEFILINFSVLNQEVTDLESLSQELIDEYLIISTLINELPSCLMLTIVNPNNQITSTKAQKKDQVLNEIFKNSSISEFNLSHCQQVVSSFLRNFDLSIIIMTLPSFIILNQLFSDTFDSSLVVFEHLITSSNQNSLTFEEFSGVVCNIINNLTIFKPFFSKFTFNSIISTLISDLFERKFTKFSILNAMFFIENFEIPFINLQAILNQFNCQLCQIFNDKQLMENMSCSLPKFSHVLLSSIFDSIEVENLDEFFSSMTFLLKASVVTSFSYEYFNFSDFFLLIFTHDKLSSSFITKFSNIFISFCSQLSDVKLTPVKFLTIISEQITQSNSQSKTDSTFTHIINLILDEIKSIIANVKPKKRSKQKILSPDKYSSRMSNLLLFLTSCLEVDQSFVIDSHVELFSLIISSFSTYSHPELLFSLMKICTFITSQNFSLMSSFINHHKFLQNSRRLLKTVVRNGFLPCFPIELFTKSVFILLKNHAELIPKVNEELITPLYKAFCVLLNPVNVNSHHDEVIQSFFDWIGNDSFGIFNHISHFDSSFSNFVVNFLSNPSPKFSSKISLSKSFCRYLKPKSNVHAIIQNICNSEFQTNNLLSWLVFGNSFAKNSLEFNSQRLISKSLAYLTNDSHLKSQQLNSFFNLVSSVLIYNPDNFEDEQLRTIYFDFVSLIATFDENLVKVTAAKFQNFIDILAYSQSLITFYAKCTQKKLGFESESSFEGEFDSEFAKFLSN
ncbi:hypothetical protein P9112_004925 [Eukaryota sp. TZLM1-RC]